MSVILEFSIGDEEFPLGRLLAGPPEMTVELERVVPTGSALVPYLWVQGDDYEAFEQQVVDDESVIDFVALDRLDDMALYRVTWEDESHSFLEAIEANRGVILEAYGTDGWNFRLRFPTQDAVSQFYTFCTERGISIHVDRSYPLTEKSELEHQFGLSHEQREALVLGLRRGYFDTPSDASLAELAEELDISRQAVSNRIRRGTKHVLSEALLSSDSNLE